MNLKYIKEDALNQLTINKVNNLEKYRSDFEWVDSYLQNALDTESLYLESRVPFQRAEIIIPSGNSREASKTDAENAKLIHSALKDLTLAQAVDERIWVYLTHVTYSEYMNARWIANKSKITEGTIDRYFASGSRGLIRNGIARLWWYGYLTYDEKREDPYELTDILLSNQDIAQGLLERNLGNNKDWLNIMLCILKDLKDDYPSLTTKKNMQNLTKHLNFSGAVTILECLSREDTQRLLKEWIFKEKIERLMVTV